ncbi:unnamed protein product [Moneuplotes crassus]|uniref:Uncharacterized protein n=1 Tax=Euplotes crassus TaxID=5936 RepID=A0AAD1XET8_EUPCR|nr:unnamed protein product [Moneuplotes crassus]
MVIPLGCQRICQFIYNYRCLIIIYSLNSSQQARALFMRAEHTQFLSKTSFYSFQLVDRFTDTKLHFLSVERFLASVL